MGLALNGEFPAYERVDLTAIPGTLFDPISVEARAYFLERKIERSTIAVEGIKKAHHNG